MPDLTQTFSALGDPTRFAIVERLLAKGELSAGELGAVADISAPALSRHFKVLRQAGVLHQRVDKQRRLYSVRPDTMQAIGDWVMTYRAFWGGSLDRLEQMLEKGPPP